MKYNFAFSCGAFRIFITAHCVAALLLLSGCGTLKDFAAIDSHCESPAYVEGAANVFLFLNVHRQDGAPVLNVKIDSIELLVDDLWLPLKPEAIEVFSGQETGAVQRFLGRIWLKGRYCRGVRVKVATATLTRGDGIRAIPVVNPETEVMLQNPVELETGARKVLLLEWEPGKSVSSAGFVGMSLKAFLGGVSRITANLVYVVCPEIDTVFVVKIDGFQVIDAFPVTGGPSYITVDSGNKKIYVLASSLNKIIPYDIFTHLPGSEIQIPLANSPGFMAINKRSQIAYILDGQGVLTSIDLVSGNMLRRNRIGNGPNYLYYIPGLEKLAVSLSIDQRVYLVNPESLAVEDSISLGSAPQGLVSWGNYLYIAENSTNSVTVYDLGARRVVQNIHVGFGPSRFVVNDSSVYVTNVLDGTISVIPGGQLNVSKEVVVGRNAREMGVAVKQRLLFVGEGECDGSLAVIDTDGNRVIGRVELGATPMGIAVAD